MLTLSYINNMLIIILPILHTVPVGAAAGVAIGVANYLLNSERKIIEVQYTRLIKTCNDDIEQLKSVVADGEEQLQKLKQIVKKSVST